MKNSMTAGDRVYQSLRGLIVRGDLKSGSPLVHRTLAKRFGTSNIPVIEAIRRLEQDGLVDSQPKWGAQVRDWTAKDLQEVYLLREALEGVAARLFAERATPADRWALVDHGQRFDEASRRMDERGCEEANLALHFHIVRSAQSAALSRFVENSCIITTACKNARWKSLPPEELGRKAGAHAEMIAALNSGDADAAERAAKSHIRRAFEELMALPAP